MARYEISKNGAVKFDKNKRSLFVLTKNDLGGGKHWLQIYKNPRASNLKEALELFDQYLDRKD